MSVAILCRTCLWLSQVYQGKRDRGEEGREGGREREREREREGERESMFVAIPCMSVAFLCTAYLWLSCRQRICGYILCTVFCGYHVYSMSWLSYVWHVCGYHVYTMSVAILCISMSVVPCIERLWLSCTQHVCGCPVFSMSVAILYIPMAILC